METLNVENLEQQILRTLNESSTGELTTQDISKKIKDVNLRQVEGILNKKLVRRKLCSANRKDQETVYSITTEGRRQVEPPIQPQDTQNQNIEQPKEVLENHQVPGTKIQPQMTPSFVQDGQIYTDSSTASMGYTQPTVQGYYFGSQHQYQQPSQSFNHQQVPPVKVKRSVLRVKPTGRVDANAQVVLNETQIAKKEEDGSNQKDESCGVVWDFLLTETRKIRSQDKAIQEVMSRPFTSGNLTAPLASSGTFLDRKVRQNSSISSQVSRPLSSLTAMGPPPNELNLASRNESQDSIRDDSNMEIELEHEQE
eukprot:g4368.t1